MVLTPSVRLGNPALGEQGFRAAETESDGWSPRFEPHVHRFRPGRDFLQKLDLHALGPRREAAFDQGGLVPYELGKNKVIGNKVIGCKLIGKWLPSQ